MTCACADETIVSSPATTAGKKGLFFHARDVTLRAAPWQYDIDTPGVTWQSR